MWFLTLPQMTTIPETLPRAQSDREVYFNLINPVSMTADYIQERLNVTVCVCSNTEVEQVAMEAVPLILLLHRFIT